MKVKELREILEDVDIDDDLQVLFVTENHGETESYSIDEVDDDESFVRLLG